VNSFPFFGDSFGTVFSFPDITAAVRFACVRGSSCGRGGRVSAPHVCAANDAQTRARRQERPRSAVSVPRAVLTAHVCYSLPHFSARHSFKSLNRKQTHTHTGKKRNAVPHNSASTENACFFSFFFLTLTTAVSL
jgi:hypothetical protein